MAALALQAVFILRFVFPRASLERRRALNGWWAGKLLRVVGLSIEVEGDPPAPGGAVVAANHVSWLDIFALQAVHPVRFVAKIEVRDWPLAGWIAERAGTLFIRRGFGREAARTNEHVHAALAQGDCVGIFPEGTTTEGDTLLKFHASLFEPAVADGVRVYPCAIRYQHPDGSLCRAVAYVGDLSFMQSLALTIRQRGVVVRVRFAAPVDTVGSSRRDVATATRERVASLLVLRPEDTAPRTPDGRQDAPR